MHATCSDLLNFWLKTCKDILALSYNSEIVRSTLYVENKSFANESGSNSDSILNDLNEADSV